MDIEIFTACDSVHSYEGKLVIIGTFHQITRVGQINNLGVAASINHNPKVEQGMREFMITFINPDGTNFSKAISGNYEISNRFINIAINVKDVKFTQRGLHYINLIIDGEIVKQTTLIVQ